MSGPSIFDIDCPDWAATNEDGVWCGFCGEILVTPWTIDDDTQCPESCPTCGGPDDIEAMAEHFC